MLKRIAGFVFVLMVLVFTIGSVSAEAEILVYPSVTYVGFSQPFRVLNSIETNETTIKIFNWDFGNGDKKTTSVGNIIYTYNETGDYDLKINFTDSKNVTYTGTFDVEVLPAKAKAQSLMTEKLTQLKNVSAFISAQNVFYGDSLKSALGLGDIELAIANVQKKNASASSDANYEELLSLLLDINIPQSIYVSESLANSPFYFEESKIDLSALEELGSGTKEGTNEQYVDAIYYWYNNDFESTFSYKKYSAYIDGEKVNVLNVFEMGFNNKGGLVPYLIVDDLENLKFDKSYGEKKKSGSVGIEIKDSVKKIIFSTTQDIGFENLPVFISPALEDLSVSSGSGGEIVEGISKWVWFTLILILLLGIGVGVYVFLKIWYDKKYEAHLFPNKNDLYNMVSYVHSSKQKKMNNSDIEKNLKKAGWSSEKISYVMKKYAGKKTGMPI